MLPGYKHPNRIVLSTIADGAGTHVASGSGSVQDIGINMDHCA
jgi:hypothetical protein